MIVDEYGITVFFVFSFSAYITAFCYLQILINCTYKKIRLSTIHTYSICTPGSTFPLCTFSFTSGNYVSISNLYELMSVIPTAAKNISRDKLTVLVFGKQQ